MNKLFPITSAGPRTFCGPAAIALLTGVPTDRIEKMIRRVRRDRSGKRVKSTWPREVLRVLERLGCKVEDRLRDSGVSLKAFAEDHRHAGAYLILVRGHWVTVANGMFADSGHHAPIPIEDYRRNPRVLHAWKVTAPAAPLYTPDDPITPPPRPKRPPVDAHTLKVQRVAARLKAWQAKERRALNAIKKLTRQLKRLTRPADPLARVA